MNDEQKTEEEVWSVEPPKKSGGKAGKVLRVALIVAALAAAAVTGVMLFGEQIRSRSIGDDIIGGAIVCDPESSVVSAADDAEAGRTAFADRIIETDIE